MKIAVTAVAFQDEGRWVAQCLEHDIAVSADSLSRLRTMFEKAVISNVCVNTELGRTGLEGIPPAPQPFWDMFDKADSKIESINGSINSLPVEISAMRVAELSAGDF